MLRSIVVVLCLQTICNDLQNYLELLRMPTPLPLQGFLRHRHDKGLLVELPFQQPSKLASILVWTVGAQPVVMDLCILPGVSLPMLVSGALVNKKLCGHPMSEFEFTPSDLGANLSGVPFAASSAPYSPRAVTGHSMFESQLLSAPGTGNPFDGAGELIITLHYKTALWR
jgi:hypothetical protein